jgi:hypothetical protein
MLDRMICPMTGKEHALFWMRSAWWCGDCHQKIETCCEGGGCPSVTEVVEVTGGGELASEARWATSSPSTRTPSTP